MTLEAKAKILVVDDDDGNRFFKSTVLRGAGYRVYEAASGEEGLSQVAREEPDVVLLDVRLPDMNGLEVCRIIKARHPATIVLQTSAARTDALDRTIALDGGADSYLVEPLEDAELIAVVRALLRLHKAERAFRSINETLEQRVAERTRELADANRRLAEEARERAKAEEALRHAEKLDAIGRLTGGVAHDFNNLLTVIVGNLDMIARGLTKSPPPVERLARLVNSAQRAAHDCGSLTSRLLAFARRDALRPEIVDINAVITQFMPLVKRAAGERVTVELSLAAELWTCCLDAKQLETALLNLIVNARDAMPEGGTIRISTSNLELPRSGAANDAGTRFPEEAASGAYVHISVADEGTGMSEEVLAHAFEPFFTTKDVGQGSGLGLSQVYGFIKQSEGYVGVESALGLGTQVGLFFPRASGGAKRLDFEENVATDLLRGAETILVVEDNETVLGFVAATLSELGYRVRLANDGRSALDVIEREPDIDLLFTDVVMPHRMSGIELAREVRRRRPEIKVLLTSGYSAYHAEAAVVPDEFRALAKPYRGGDLARRVREALDNQS